MNKEGFLFLALLPAQLLAWGERGHDIVAQTAVRISLESEDQGFHTPFYKRSLMLGHLANVPDIVWKSDSMSEKERQLNNPTHYISLDKVYKNTSFKDISRDIKTFRAKAKEAGLNLDKKVGTATWRVSQLFNLMKQSFKDLKVIPPTDSRYVDKINQALLYGGIMAHFVGDLANPQHSSRDYDGWSTGQGGLHAYFESDCVAALPLSLSQKVFDHARSEDLLEDKIFSKFVTNDSEQLKKDPTAIVFALAYDSLHRLSHLLDLDRKHAVVKESRNDRGLMIPAKRKSPHHAALKMQPFIVERLSLGASVLQHLWLLAWKQAGEPDLSDFQSWYYPVKPEFIMPDYLENSR